MANEATKRARSDRELDEQKLSYRVDEACIVTGLKRATFYRLVKDGKIQIKKVDRCTLVMRSELQRYLDSL